MTLPLRLFVVAGEPSGDLLGAALVAALRRLSPRPLRIDGVGGPALIGQGLRRAFPMQELTVMGLAEVLPRLAGLARRLDQVARRVRGSAPDLVLTVDSPGFNLRLLRRIGAGPWRRVHYVAPQAWAWAPWRAARLAGLMDRLLALLPFEPAFFAGFGVEARFVGHPVVERMTEPGDRDGFIARHRLGEAAPILLLLPGSRRQEVERHLPVLGEALTRLRPSHPRLAVVLAAAPGQMSRIAEMLRTWLPRPIVVEAARERVDAMAAADLAIAASGTATLELALKGVPMLVAHRLHPLTGLMAQHLVRLPHVALVNIILDRPVVPELLQWACTPDRIGRATRALLDDPAARLAQRSAFAELAAMLRPADGALPSEAAARAVLELTAADCGTLVRSYPAPGS
jgi:lipid-A-disaccharide synthase